MRLPCSHQGLFLRGLALALIAMTAASTAWAADQQAKRPNILFIMADDKY